MDESMKVVLEYADDTKKYVWDSLDLRVSGELHQVANWIDEHVIAPYVLRGGSNYVQGAAIPGIKLRLAEGGEQEFGDVLFFVGYPKQG